MLGHWATCDSELLAQTMVSLVLGYRIALLFDFAHAKKEYLYP